MGGPQRGFTDDDRVVKTLFEITGVDRTNATANMTVVVRTSSADAAAVDLREVSASLRKVNGTWLIAGAQVRASRDEQ